MRRGSQPLLLCAALLAGCNFEAVPIGTEGQSSQPELTEDEKLALYGEHLQGTWRGVPIAETLFDMRLVGLVLRWMPDADTPRSGTLDIQCVNDGVECLRGSFRYSLYELTDDDTVKGALELSASMGQVQGLASLELTFQGADDVSLVAAASAVPFGFPFVRLSGIFTKDPAPVVVPVPPSSSP